MMDHGPEITEVTWLGSNSKTFIPSITHQTIHSTTNSLSATYFDNNGEPYKLGWDKDTGHLKKESSRKFKIQDICLERYGRVIGALCDTDADDLSTDHILKLVETMKAKLMFKTMAMRISHFECKMTPLVRETIIRTWKKLNMYGKQPPFVPRFDEYLNELPEKFNVEGGIIVKMIDPKDYGELYFELDAIQSNKTPTQIINDLTFGEKIITLGERKPLWHDDDLPF